MEELVAILTDIRDQLVELNNRIDQLTGYGSGNISDVCDKLEDVSFSLDNVNLSLEEVNLSLDTIDITKD